ncbi:hypothetical protein THMIRHAS_02170 [Thiosulfatimonas sediminis]|uniref:Histidine phosphatase family protein n=2 Tax=Thiosulfatimonas sediminis TaxID=2675054 RepID=A0A6F8PS34_9GAMM|nr:hypothetical protein THMIRHAS_02170 [Thiosulfatimonas sediminis]
MTSSSKYSVRTLFALLLFLFVSIVVAAQSPAQKPEFAEKIATQALLKQLQNGGLVIYMRHGYTDNHRPDQAPKVDLADCTTQRVLNQQGINITTQVGHYLRQAQIPIGEVFSSPMCRAKDSAKNAFGKFTVDNNLMYYGAMTSAEKKPVIANTQRLVSTPVAAGSNRVVVAHAPNMVDLINYFPEEATLVIFEPLDNGQFDYLGSIRPKDWPALLQSLTP